LWCANGKSNEKAGVPFMFADLLRAQMVSHVIASQLIHLHCYEMVFSIFEDCGGQMANPMKKAGVPLMTADLLRMQMVSHVIAGQLVHVHCFEMVSRFLRIVVGKWQIQ